MTLLPVIFASEPPAPPPLAESEPSSPQPAISIADANIPAIKRSDPCHRPLHPLPGRLAQCPPMGQDERITRGMRSQLGDRRRALARDDRGLGWKLGFGTPAAMQKLGIEAPLVGYLLESARLESGAVVDISNWGNARLEPEIVARVGEDGGIAAIGAAIELVDLDPNASDPEAILETDIFQRHVLLGPVTEGASVADVSLRLYVNGEEVAAADDVTEATGDLDGLVAHVAKTLEAAGESLERGDMVICGSIVPALAIAPGDEVEVRLEPLGTPRRLLRVNVRHLERIREALGEAGADALWVHPAVDFRYLTGLTPIAMERPTALVILADGVRMLAPEMLAPELAIEGAELTAWSDGDGPEAAIARVLDGVSRCLIEPDLPSGVAFALRAARPKLELVLDPGVAERAA